MHIDNYYKKFWVEAIHHFQNDEFEYDELIDDRNDKRFGLTVLLRPTAEVKKNINDMLTILSQIEPDQYFYPVSDMHVTILSVVGCYNGFTRQSFDAPAYCKVIKESLHNISPFKIHFQGITASMSCVMVQGFPSGELNLIRQQLRNNFSSSGLQISFDERYTIMLAHSTVMRFKAPLKHKKKFILKLEEFRQRDFGCSNITNVEFVFNDWYQRIENGDVLANFKLPNPATVPL